MEYPVDSGTFENVVRRRLQEGELASDNAHMSDRQYKEDDFHSIVPPSEDG